MSGRVDLNCDMGESFGAYSIGADEAVFPHITSANIACGFHGGDPSVMRVTVARAKTHGVAIGAHPGFPDLIGFGRRSMDLSPDDIYDLMVYQIGALLGVARAQGVERADHQQVEDDEDQQPRRDAHEQPRRAPGRAGRGSGLDHRHQH